ncbi:MAG: FecR domain-containing protein [Bacteroidales bacterium]|jgi:ferric-dicitrate binding protein FerR (iron transport regulator)|nr:FecR domain-containing protein [Bacteroidales bacterium]
MKNIKVEPKWKNSKEQIWADHFEKIVSVEQLVAKSPSLFSHKRRFQFAMAVAAIFAAILLIPSIYVRSFETSIGERVTVTLPDGSGALLNSQSSISYKPLLWFSQRVVKMSGEIFYTVKSGSSFRVNSSNGVVSVLGTKFNVFSREDNFSVTCYSGMVGVEADGVDPGTTLESNTRLFRSAAGNFTTERSNLYEIKNSWVENKFLFKAEPLKNVIDEIRRQYNISISYDETLNYYYTGNFSKLEDPLLVLEIVTLPFELKIVLRDGVYNIVN